MSKIVKLTESDLTRLVKKVIEEQRSVDEEGELSFEFNDRLVFLRDLTQKKVQHYLSKLPETVRFLAIVDCEAVDFSDIDLCSFPDLYTVNLRGTPNNFEETVDCDYDFLVNGIYEMKK